MKFRIKFSRYYIFFSEKSFRRNSFEIAFSDVNPISQPTIQN